MPSIHPSIHPPIQFQPTAKDTHEFHLHCRLPVASKPLTCLYPPPTHGSFMYNGEGHHQGCINAPVNKKNDAETNFWTKEEYDKFISCIDNEYYKLLFEFMYYTGCRLGEVIGLTWENVDFDTKTIKIYDNLTTKIEDKHKINGKSYGVFKPKTNNSIRELILDNVLTEHLKKHYINESKLYGFTKKYLVFGIRDRAF